MRQPANIAYSTSPSAGSTVRYSPSDYRPLGSSYKQECREIAKAPLAAHRMPGSTALCAWLVLALAPGSVALQVTPGVQARAVSPPAIATTAAEQQKVSSLRAINVPPPQSSAAFDLAELVATRDSVAGAPWRHAFRALVTDQAFIEQGWAQRRGSLAKESGSAAAHAATRRQQGPPTCSGWPFRLEGGALGRALTPPGCRGESVATL